MELNQKELLEFRGIIRLSVGDYADKFSEDELNDIASTLLQTTTIALRAKHLQKSYHLKSIK